MVFLFNKIYYLNAIWKVSNLLFNLPGSGSSLVLTWRESGLIGTITTLQFKGYGAVIMWTLISPILPSYVLSLNSIFWTFASGKR